MPKVIMNYNNTIIYKIVCDDLNIKDVYVGHTTNFDKRKCQHKSRCNNENDTKYHLNVYQCIRFNQGWSNWSMIEIEKYKCNDKYEAEKRERYYIEDMKATLNKTIPTRTDLEYRMDNKDKILENALQYRINNKDKINQYRIINKDKLKESALQYRIINKDKILENALQYRIHHKDKIHQYEMNNKDKKKAYNKQYNKDKKQKMINIIQMNEIIPTPLTDKIIIV
jgi:hypothetical protein